MRLTSQAFEDGEVIPARYTATNTNELPPLEIDETPAGTQSLVVLIEDPDSPLGKEVTHWLAWNIPPETHHLDATHVPEGTRLGTDTFGKIGYTGPNPPEGCHHYHLHVFALDTELELPAGANRSALDHAMKGRVLDEAELTGVFEHYMDGEEE
jgi:Raf kinase inhibitor-like YbhB/YbcL family protein